MEKYWFLIQDFTLANISTPPKKLQNSGFFRENP